METVQVHGLSELGEALKEFGSKIGMRYLRKATSDAAAVFRDDARMRAPVLTGAMRDAIAIFKRRDTDASTAHYSVGVGKLKVSKKLRRIMKTIPGADPHIVVAGNQFYWRYVEFGTSHAKAKPFLRPAFESQKSAALEKFRQSLALGVEQAAKR